MIVVTKNRTKKKRRLPRFGLNTFLFVITIFCVVLGWRVNRAQQQKRAAAMIWGVGVFGYDFEVTEDGEFTGGDSQVPLALRRFLGQDFFHNITIVTLGETYFVPNANGTAISYWPVTDEHLGQLKHLPELKTLRILPQLPDDSIERLAQLDSLTTVVLRNNSPTDDGVKKLKTIRPYLDVQALAGDYERSVLGCDDKLTEQRWLHDMRR